MNVQIIIETGMSEEETKNSGKEVTYQNVKATRETFTFEISGPDKRDELLEGIGKTVQKARQ